MRKTTGQIVSSVMALTIVVLTLLGLTSCFGSPNTTSVQIDWVNFVKFNGITYLSGMVNAGRALQESDLGPVFATVKKKLDGNVTDPTYHSQDGDAAFLDVGTSVYAVKGYLATFRLAARYNGQLTLFEADTNPQAKKGADLLDIGGKVRSIGINSAQNVKAVLGAIRDAKVVTSVVDMVLAAPVDQNRMSQGGTQYFLVFYLQDGTAVSRVYNFDANELSRGILPLGAFKRAIQLAVTK